jgi:GNAT superfamily N-acetyltransferase
MNSHFDCRLLTLADREAAARVLSQAFVDDPLSSFMLPFGRTRIKTIYKYFIVYGGAAIKSNRGYGIGEPLQGVAFWKHPKQEDLSISARSLSGIFSLVCTFFPIGYFRAKRVLKEQEAMQKKYTNEPYFLLENIGVLPSTQGKGLSSKLIRPSLEMADTQKVIVYTDTYKHSNVSLYEHFGFHCVENRSIKGTGLTVWAMRREVNSTDF